MELRLYSALSAGVLSFASPKESSPRKGAPQGDAGLRPVPSATRRVGRLRNSPLRGSNSPRRHRTTRLRCSASSRGVKGVALERSEQKKRLVTVDQDFWFFFPVDRNTVTIFPLPSTSSSSTGRHEKKGEDCLRPVGPSSAAPHADRAAQRTRRQPGGVVGAPSSLATFFLARQEESTPAFNAEYSLSPIPKNPKKSPLIFGLRTRSTVDAPGVHP